MIQIYNVADESDHVCNTRYTVHSSELFVILAVGGVLLQFWTVHVSNGISNSRFLFHLKHVNHGANNLWCDEETVDKGGDYTDTEYNQLKNERVSF